MGRGRSAGARSKMLFALSPIMAASPKAKYARTQSAVAEANLYIGWFVPAEAADAVPRRL